VLLLLFDHLAFRIGRQHTVQDPLLESQNIRSTTDLPSKKEILGRDPHGQKEKWHVRASHLLNTHMHTMASPCAVLSTSSQDATASTTCLARGSSSSRKVLSYYPVVLFKLPFRHPIRVRPLVPLTSITSTPSVERSRHHWSHLRHSHVECFVEAGFSYGLEFKVAA
jgi:hypothetical protein